MKRLRGPGRTVTIRDVAREAFVSISTASTALSGGRYVHADTLARVLRVAKKLRYSPDILARSLRGGRPPFLAVIGYNHYSWPQSQILKYIVEALRGRDHLLFVLPENTLNPQEAEVRLENIVSHGLIGGLIAQVGHGVPDETIVGILSAGVTVVTTERRISGAHSVSVDNLTGGRLAAQLLGPLCPRFLVITVDVPSFWAEDRVHGFVTTLVSAGHPRTRIRQIVSSAYSPEVGERLASKIHVVRNSGLGIFCASGDAVAIGILRGLVRRGLKAGRDFRLVGYDDTPMAGAGVIGLTTIQQPFEKIGSLAVEMALLSPELEHPEPRHVILQPSLVVRETV